MEATRLAVASCYILPSSSPLSAPPAHISSSCASATLVPNFGRAFSTSGSISSIGLSLRRFRERTEDEPESDDDEVDGVGGIEGGGDIEDIDSGAHPRAERR